MKQSKLIDRFRIDRPKSFRLAEFDPGETAGFKKTEAETIVKAHAELLGELQERLYAEDRWSLLIILQGVDAAGKDGVIKRVMADLNPQGCSVHPFKVPTSEELEHDFLWRVVKRLPYRGDIAIFNRSHYEDVLVVRVHEDLLEKRRLPPVLVTGRIWQERFEDIIKLEDVFLLQDELAHTIVGVLATHVRKAETERARVKPPSSWLAHDYYMQAADTLNTYQSVSAATCCGDARRLLEQALAIDLVTLGHMRRSHWPTRHSGSIAGMRIAQATSPSNAPTSRRAQPCS